MPSPFIHLALASSAADALPLAAAERPALLLGSIAPDARSVTGQSREATHFWSSHNDVSGALKLLVAYPGLQADRLLPAERAYVAGYLAHLVADEQWTLLIYRRFFGRRSKFGASQEGAQLQLALHTVLEEERELARPPMHALIGELRAAQGFVPPVECASFLAPETLEQWRALVVRQWAKAPGKERLASLLEAVAHDDARETREERDRRRNDLLERLDGLRQEARTYVVRDALEDFEARAIRESTSFVRDYLAGTPPRPPLGTVLPG